MTRTIEVDPVGGTNAAGPAARWARGRLDDLQIYDVGIGAAPMDNGNVRILLDSDDAGKLDRAVDSLLRG